MRLPYTTHNLPNPNPNPTTTTTTEEDQAIIARIAARRAPRPLQPLDLALLHAPPVADGWNSFLGAIRTRTTQLDAAVRELVICRVAVCNRAWYEWGHHAPLALAAGVSEAALARGGVVRFEGAYIDKNGGLGSWEEAGLTEKQWVALNYADEMTRNVRVGDGTFEELRRVCGGGVGGEREVVEITATVGLETFFFLLYPLFFSLAPYLLGLDCSYIRAGPFRACLRGQGIEES